MAQTSHGSAAHAGHAGPGHIVPVKLLTSVWLALMVLTVITVAVTWVDLGAMNLWIAMGIATIKAALVVMFFMHLYWDRPINAVVFVLSLFLVTLFIGFALTDTTEYSPSVIPDYAPEITAPKTPTAP
mgnify:CR=1 FL=1